MAHPAHIATRLLALLAAALVAVPGLAADGGIDRPAPPAVDYDALPEGAAERPINPNDKPHQAFARLLVDREAVVPGEPFRMGIELVPDEGWHSYWKSPGDIGMPVTVDWSLPEGTEVAPPGFPVPQRFEQSGIVSYGYAGPVVVFSEVTLPADHPTGEPVAVQADASWLVCEATCIPGEVDLEFPLQVVDEGDPAAGPSAFAPLFDHYAAQHPTALAEVETFGVEHALSQSAYRPGDAFEAVFRIAPTGDQPLELQADEGTWPVFTPIVDSYQIFLYESSFTPTDDGGGLVILKGDALEIEQLPERSRIGGLLQVKVGDEWVRTEYTAPVPWVAAGSEVQESASPLWDLAASDGAPLDVEGAAAQAEAAEQGALAATGTLNLVTMLFLAFLGGMLLNVMPCVFPVITLKLFGLVNHAHGSPSRRHASALAYTGGILVSFWVLAGAVLVLKATVGGIGWGFQFQSPIYVAALATIVFAFGLSLFGVFEIPAVGGGAAARASTRHGLAGDFLNGVFATLLATPCTAPFLGTATGFAFAQPGWVIVLFFTVIALGLALPFAAVAFVPKLMGLLPKPGAWMETFKQLLGFTLVATAIWLVSILARQVGTDGAIGFMAFLGTVSLGAWLFGRWGGIEQSGSRQLAALAAALVVSALGGWYFLDLEQAAAQECAEQNLVTDLSWDREEIPWQDFSSANVEALAGHPVFIDFTADWCLTCKVNEKTVLDTTEVRRAMEQHGVIPLVADWTSRDSEITEWLQRYDRAGVPFYLVIPADPAAEPITLPEVLTRSTVVDALEQASNQGEAAM